MDGVDLLPRLRPGDHREALRAAAERIVLAESGISMWNVAPDQIRTGRRGQRTCLRGPRYTLCERQKLRPGHFALYDHELDPLLEKNIAREHSEIVAELREAWSRWPPESARQRTARTARFKLIQHPRFEGGYQSILIDLEADPSESQDVSAQHPELVERLRTALEDWIRLLPADDADRPLDPGREEALRALGYIE